VNYFFFSPIFFTWYGIEVTFPLPLTNHISKYVSRIQIPP
jgi:hypothetical protein